VAFPGRYYDAGDFSEGFAYVCEIKGKSLKSNNGKYGFINTKGQLVINYSFDGAANFKKGYAIIAKKNTDKKNFGDREYVFSVIDTTGKQISNKWFSSIQIVGDTAYALIKDKGYYLRLKGEFSDSLIEYLQKNEVLEPDILPQFQGGDNALFKYIHQNVNYPIWAKLMGIQGTVDVNFFVNSLGKVVGVEIEKGVHPLLNKEACRVVKSFPDWIPGMSGEKCVMVRLRVPIYFAPD
jgi:TonB family protein